MSKVIIISNIQMFSIIITDGGLDVIITMNSSKRLTKILTVWDDESQLRLGLVA